ncbi:MAG: DUF3108 domain-containing protein [Bacteroidales bacterium]|nr:DUF3108 domain-containing protein [Bacteroidales bacterium]
MIKHSIKFFYLVLVIFGLIISLPCNLNAQEELRHKPNRAFQTGEYLKYRIYFHSFVTGKISAGYATLKIQDEAKELYERETMHVVGKGKTSTALGWFYNVDDHYETYIDQQTLAPWKFIRRVNEGGYIINHDTYFDQRKSVAYFKNNKSGKRKTLETTKYPQDLVSLIYYARTLDYNNAKEGDIFSVDFVVDDTSYTARLKYAGKENIDTDLGKFRCIKIIPLLKMEGVFNEEDPMVLFVTDDKNRIPLYGESELKVGSIRLELLEYENLRNYFSSIIRWND